MGILSTFKSIVKISDWTISLGGRLKKWWKGLVNARNEKKIDKAIDTLDTDSVERILHRIKRKRDKRRDAS